MKIIIRRAGCAVLLLTAWGLGCETAAAHGFAGKRFFPATLATEDPFVADELSLPTISSRKAAGEGDEPAAHESSASLEFSKRITPKFGIGFGASHLRLHPEGEDVQKGFDNYSASAKYQLYESDAHEAIVSIGADWDIGGTGSKSVGAESFSTVTPAVFFGKGFGDLPEGAKYLRPLALTGAAGVAIPSRSHSTLTAENGDIETERHPHVLELGLALQYSLPYLQSFVKDVGLGAPFDRMIPVVEFSLEKPFDRGGGPTTGTVNPGLLWAGQHMQFGLEAIIPVNGRSGSGVGVLAQLHFFLDDLFPKTIGRPLFGAER